MLLFYLDEKGTEGLTQQALAAHPFFMMGAMRIQDTQRLSLCRHLRQLKDSFFPGWQQQDWKNFEIKGSYLAQAVRRQKRGLPPLRPDGYRGLIGGKLGKFIDELFNLVHRFNPTYYVVAVDKTGHLQKYPTNPPSPVGLAYAHLQIRAALLVAEVFGSDEGGIFIADEENHHEALFRKGEIRKIRDDVARRTRRPANMEVVLDKPIWVNQGELTVEREIGQLTDFGLYVIGTAILQEWWHNNQWLERLSPYIARHWKTGDVWDGGLTILPRPKSYPAIPFLSRPISKNINSTLSGPSQK